MFRVQNTILSDEVATAKFSCNLQRCKGACCVVGDAGAPLDSSELPVIQEAFAKLKGELTRKARHYGENHGVFRGDSMNGYELGCVDGGECIFALRDENNIVFCAIQKAYMEGRFDWEKPLSCHLFPVRLKRYFNVDYASFDYISSTCSEGCRKGNEEDTYLADFLEEPLVRRYGRTWYDEFVETCEEVRERNKERGNVIC